MSKKNFLKILIKVFVLIAPTIREAIIADKNEDETILDEVIDGITAIIVAYGSTL